MNHSPVQQLTAEECAQLVGAATDQQIEEGIRAAETTEVLDRIFAEMADRFRPERAAGVQLFMLGRLRISGALPLAVRLNGFFDRPPH